jgi:hypothetical protein
MEATAGLILCRSWSCAGPCIPLHHLLLDLNDIRAVLIQGHQQAVAKYDQLLIEASTTTSVRHTYPWHGNITGY